MTWKSNDILRQHFVAIAPHCRETVLKNKKKGKTLGSVSIENNRTVIVLLAVLTLIAVGAVLKMAEPIILPLVVAWLLSYLLGPVVDFMQKLRVPLALAVVLTLVMVLVMGLLAGLFLNARVSVFASAFPRYQERLMQLFASLTEATKLSPDVLSKIDWTERVGGFLMLISGSMVNFIVKFFTVLIFLVFLLLGRPYFRYKMEHAFSVRNADKIAGIINSISSQIGKYLALQFFISLATGFCVWLGLSLIGLDFPVTWGAFAFFLNFIPTVGSIVASVPPILVALVQFESPWRVVLVCAVLLLIQGGIGNVLSPKIMGERLHLSPMVVLVSLMFWGWLWGFMGALLSVPIASAIKIVCENIEALRPISVMMGSGKSYKGESDRGLVIPIN